MEKKLILNLNIIDPRVEQYPMTGSPIPIIALVACYVYFVVLWGPKYMKSRPAYDLNGFIKIYNLIQIVTNLYIGFFVSAHYLNNFFEILLNEMFRFIKIIKTTKQLR